MTNFDMACQMVSEETGLHLDTVRRVMLALKGRSMLAPMAHNEVQFQPRRSPVVPVFNPNRDLFVE